MAKKTVRTKADGPLGGFSLDELLGLDPVIKTKKEQRRIDGDQGPIGKAVSAPFRLVGSVVRLPFAVAGKLGQGLVGIAGEILRLPGRAGAAAVRPWRRSGG